MCIFTAFSMTSTFPTDEPVRQCASLGQESEDFRAEALLPAPKHTRVQGFGFRVRFRHWGTSKPGMKVVGRTIHLVVEDIEGSMTVKGLRGAPSGQGKGSFGLRLLKRLLGLFWFGLCD